MGDWKSQTLLIEVPDPSNAAVAGTGPSLSFKPSILKPDTALPSAPKLTTKQTPGTVYNDVPVKSIPRPPAHYSLPNKRDENDWSEALHDALTMEPQHFDETFFDVYDLAGISLLGAGSYGVVFRAKRRDSGQWRAIKLSDNIDNIQQELAVELYLKRLDPACSRSTHLICETGYISLNLGPRFKMYIEQLVTQKNSKIGLKLAPFLKGLMKYGAVVLLESSYAGGRSWSETMSSPIGQLDGRLLDKTSYQTGPGALHRPKAKRMKPADTARLFVTAAAAVRFMHLHGLYHRDIKPGNLLLLGKPGSYESVLIDVGIACVVGDVGARQSCAGPYGTEVFRAPNDIELTNQYKGKTLPEFLAAAKDMYALGLSFFDWLTSELTWAIGPRDEALVQTILKAPDHAAVLGPFRELIVGVMAPVDKPRLPTSAAEFTAKYSNADKFYQKARDIFMELGGSAYDKTLPEEKTPLPK
jgi:serine/threonine protein kinase